MYKVDRGGVQKSFPRTGPIVLNFDLNFDTPNSKILFIKPYVEIILLNQLNVLVENDYFSIFSLKKLITVMTKASLIDYLYV